MATKKKGGQIRGKGGKGHNRFCKLWCSLELHYLVKNCNCSLKIEKKKKKQWG